MRYILLALAAFLLGGCTFPVSPLMFIRNSDSSSPQYCPEASPVLPETQMQKTPAVETQHLA